MADAKVRGFLFPARMACAGTMGVFTTPPGAVDEGHQPNERERERERERGEGAGVQHTHLRLDYTSVHIRVCEGPLNLICLQYFCDHYATSAPRKGHSKHQKAYNGLMFQNSNQRSPNFSLPCLVVNTPKKSKPKSKILKLSMSMI